ncbi:mediator of RNA polymerase II transcription subunit 8-like [Stylophora pistillata]|uniref:Mediator of RNA polymerase II transcription subunit 8 n=1 Tax=Stylophora pistillata TaxID=50429 RepID=A0A2B4SMQ0_STYPI|nr:mediator of RNA polymerase II transcription subunit 8-like [Stylophora pistillata]PFX30150.1 Mediator of RNA polymerase II transcription subunit 8 [Stylophora pistillata]
MQDEKLLEVSLEAVSSRVQELKEAIQAFLMKLEHEQMNWPSVLDNYALLSGQVNTLTKLLKNEKTPLFRNLVLLPVLVQQETDPDIQKASEGRIHAFDHEVVPDYLRTKYAPEIEESEQKVETMATNIPPDEAQRQKDTLNELVENLLTLISSAREDWEGEQSAASRSSSAVNPDLNNLVVAVTFGRGLKPAKVTKGRGSKSDKAQSGWMSDKSTNKAPSSVKTETKAAAGVHPYSMPNRPTSRTGP